MTVDMIMGLVRQVLPAVGMVLVMLGWLEQGAADDLMNKVFVAIGAMMTVGSSIWSMLANTKASILQSVEAMPEVSRIEIRDPDLKRKMGSSPKVR